MIQKRKGGEGHWDQPFQPWLSLPWHGPQGWACLCGVPAGKHHPGLFSEVKTQATIISCHSKLKAQAHRPRSGVSTASGQQRAVMTGQGWSISFKGMSHSRNTQNKQRHKSPWKRPTSESESLRQEQSAFWFCRGSRAVAARSARWKMSLGLCLW